LTLVPLECEYTPRAFQDDPEDTEQAQITCFKNGIFINAREW
jgi:hypothetical protein